MGGVKNALKTVNFEEAFEDDVEDAAIHGIEKAGVEICVDVKKLLNILICNNFNFESSSIFQVFTVFLTYTLISTPILLAW